MEKATFLPQQTSVGQSKWRPRSLRCFERALLLFIVLLHGYGVYKSIQSDAWTGSHNHATEDASNSGFDWRRIPSQRQIRYYPCYHSTEASFECARLSVPLDHFNHTTKAEISLAIIRLPAPVPPSHPQYGGAILFNPGGPGGSGVGFLQRGWKPLTDAIHDGQDANDTKFYDFISFDPRGVGYSSPMLSCFDTDLLSWTWLLRVYEEGILGSSDAAFGRLWSMSKALGGSCSLSAGHDPEDIKKFVSTASVAADMVEIVERHGQWREAEARRLLSLSQGFRTTAVPEGIKYQQGRERINYWGFSYGTYLGMTFASMYPERIARFIIDGVVDAEDYAKSLWYDNLADTEKEMKSFYQYCSSAGYPACALANKTTEKTSAADIEARVNNILSSLVHNPLPVIGERPEVITYSDAKHLIFVGLYTPIASFPTVADTLASIENGDGAQMAARLRSKHEPYCPSTASSGVVAHEGAPRRSKDIAMVDEAAFSISCSDGDPQDALTREDIRKHWEKLTKLSPTIGPIWATYRMQCVHYTVRPLHRYVGPWSGNTSFPVLFIGNSADPVTPVRNAQKMAKGYKDARVLEQESSGHCSVAAPSKCTRSVVYRYIQHGELPKGGTLCEVDEYPFGASLTGQTQSLDDVSGRHRTDVPAGFLMPVV